MYIAILGAGTWGIALAKLLSENGHDICVWSALPKEIETLSKTYTHPNLPDVSLPQTLQFTTDLEAAVSNAQYVVFAVATA